MRARYYTLFVGLAVGSVIGVTAGNAVGGGHQFIWGVARALSSVGHEVGLTVTVADAKAPMPTLAVEVQPVEFFYDVTVYSQLDDDGPIYHVSKDGTLTAVYGDTVIVLEPQPDGGFLPTVLLPGT